MASTDASSTTQVSPVTGLLVFDSGQPITGEAVANLIDEECCGPGQLHLGSNRAMRRLPEISHFVADDGARLACHRINPAEVPMQEPAVMLPGGPCRGVEYLTDLAGVGETRPIVVFHPRGTPTSPGLSRGWWRDASDVVGLADHLGLEAFDLVGHSAGTRLALAVATQFPRRVRSIALITPPAAWLTGTPDDGVQVARARHDPLIDAAVASALGAAPADQAAFERDRCVQDPAGYVRWTTKEQQHARLGAVSLAAAQAWFTDIPDDAAAQILGASLPPTLIIGGNCDIWSGVRPVRAMADALGAELVMLDDCGHYPWIEQPEQFAAALGGWLRRC